MVLLAPFPLTVLGVKYPWQHTVSVSGIACAILLLLHGMSGILLIHYYVVVPFAMAEAVRRGFTISRTIVMSVCAPMLFSVFILAVRSVWTQQTPQALLMQYFTPVLQMLREYSETLPPDSQTAQSDRETFQTLLPQLFIAFLPALTAINYMLTNVINYLLVRRYCQARATPIPFDPPDVTLWRASDYLVWVFLASGVGLLLPSGFLSHLSLNVFAVTLMIYCFQGIAIALFWGRRLPLSPGALRLIGVLLLLFASLPCIVLCTAAGLFDQWVDFRRQRQQSSIL